jgi:hypothetical protein
MKTFSACLTGNATSAEIPESIRRSCPKFIVPLIARFSESNYHYEAAPKASLQNQAQK